MKAFNAVVWVDATEARVLAFGTCGNDVSIHAKSANGRVERNTRLEPVGGSKNDGYLSKIVTALKGARKVLILGPTAGKRDLMRYVHAHRPDLDERIVGRETLNQPWDGQILPHARKYFGAPRRRPRNGAIA